MTAMLHDGDGKALARPHTDTGGVISLLMSDSTIETISPAIKYFVHLNIEQLAPPGIKYPSRAKSI